MCVQCGGYPDVIIAADCIYEVQFHEALMATLHQCMASHSVAFFSFRRRTAKEQSFATTAAVGLWVGQYLMCCCSLKWMLWILICFNARKMVWAGSFASFGRLEWLGIPRLALNSHILIALRSSKYRVPE